MRTLAETVERARQGLVDIANDPSIETEYERLFILTVMREYIEDRIFDLRLATAPKRRKS